MAAFETNRKLGEGFVFDEKHFIEFPTGLAGERPPTDPLTKAPIKTLKFEQWINTEDQTRVLQEWMVGGTDVYGLPRGNDLCLLFLLMQLWQEQGFQNRKVVIGRLYRVLKAMGLPDTRQYYDRVREALNRLIGTTYYTKYAVYDTRKGKLIPKFNFNILDSVAYDYNELEEMEHLGKSEPLGYVMFTDAMLFLVQNGHFKPTNVDRYWRIPTSRGREVFRFLDNRRPIGRVQRFPAFLFAKKVGTHDRTLKAYSPKDIRKVFEADLGFLVKEERYLSSFRWVKAGRETFLEVRYAGDDADWVDLSERELALVRRIVAAFDDPGSKGFYKRTAAELGYDTVYELFETVQDARKGGRVKNPGAYFTKLAQEKRKSAASMRETRSKAETCPLCQGTGRIDLINERGEESILLCHHKRTEDELQAYIIANKLRLTR